MPATNSTLFFVICNPHSSSFLGPAVHAYHCRQTEERAAWSAHLVHSSQGEARGALGAAQLLADQHQHLEQLQLVRLRAQQAGRSPSSTLALLGT